MKNLFARIAGRYDAMNKIMSLGLDRRWRKAAVRRVNLPHECKILDLACGTGDFTLELAKRWPDAEILGVDLTPEMLHIAREKLQDAPNAHFILADAQNLPIEKDADYSLVVCAFGFRNFPDKAKALAECNRMLDSRGLLVVLELFRARFSLLGAAVNIWLTLTSWLFASGMRSEYRYLRRSLAATVSSSEFIALAQQKGFRAVKKRFYPPAATCITFAKAGSDITT